MRTIDMILLIVTLVILTPWVVYLSVKLGAFGFYRGRQLFDEMKKEK